MSNRGSNEGYALLDALLAALIVAMVAAAALPGIGIAARFAARVRERSIELVESRNSSARRHMGLETRETVYGP